MRSKVFRSSLGTSLVAPRAVLFTWTRPTPQVGKAGQYKRSEAELGEIEGALTPLEAAQRVPTGPGTDIAADAVVYVRDEFGPFRTGDILEREGARWEVIQVSTWEEVSLHVLEVRALVAGNSPLNLGEGSS